MDEIMNEQAINQPVGSEAGNGPLSIECDEAVHQLYHYLDGELTEERRSQISRHLDDCSPCGAAAHFEAELRHVIADRCRDRVPEALIERVALSINEEQRHGTDG
ncbi:MAG: mycothiol system anti-sigma-R factor [Actinomycetes bacterium]